MRQALWHIGKSIAVYSTMLMLIPAIVFLICLIGPLVHKEQLILTPPFDTFYAKSVPKIDSRHQINLYPVKFNGSNLMFDALDRMSTCHFAFLLKTANAGDTILREQSVQVFMRTKKRLTQVTLMRGDSVYDWTQLCSEQTCTDQWNALDSILDSGHSVRLTYPQTFLTHEGGSRNASSPVFLGNTIGGVETDLDGVISSARALSSEIRLREDLHASIKMDFEWAFRELLQQPLSSSYAAGLELSWWSLEEFLRSVKTSTGAIYFWLAVCAVLMTVLTVVCTFSQNSYTSRPFVGLSIATCCILPCIAGLSLHFTNVAQFNSMVFPVFFILSGVVLILLMTLVQSGRKYSNAAADPREKLAFILSWDGPCLVSSIILVTGNFLIIGAATTLPYLQYLFLSLAGSLFLVLIFSLFLFCVIYYLSGRREAKGVKWYRFWERGDTHFAMPMMRDYNEDDLSLIHEKLTDTQTGVSLSGLTGRCMASLHMRYISLFIYCLYLMGAVWGCSSGQIDLKEDYFLAKNSTVRRYLHDYRTFFGRYEEYIEMHFDHILDYDNPNTQRQIFDLLNWAIEEQYATRSVSWLQEFARFAQSSIYVINRDTFVPVVNLVFLRSSPFDRFTADIAFDKYQSQITASRMYLQLSSIGVNQRLELINGLLWRAREHGLPLQVRCPFVFLLEHDLQSVSAILTVSLVTVGLLAAFSLVLFAQPTLAVLTPSSVISLVVGTVGYSVLWSVPLNIVTLGIAMAGGTTLQAVIASHFCYHFSVAGPSQSSSLKRVEYAFESIFWPSLAGCLVPIVAYLPLMLSAVPITVHIWKVLCLTAVLSLGHLLLFLPNATVLFNEQIPQCLSMLKSFLEDICCNQCCDVEENTASIYYIPTGSRSFHPRPYVNHYALPGPAVREMILPAPGSMKCNSLAAHHPFDPNLVRRPNSRCLHTSDLEGSYHFAGNMNSPATTIKRRGVGEGRSSEESIYEAPPSPRHNKERSRRGRSSVKDCGNGRVFEEDPYQLNSEPAPEDDVPPIGMRPNWRQYLLDGSIRRPIPPPDIPIVGMLPPHPVGSQPPVTVLPVCIAAPPPTSHIIRPYRGLTRLH